MPKYHWGGSCNGWICTSDKIVSGALRGDKETLIECIADKRFKRTITNKVLVFVKNNLKKQ